MSRDFLGNTYEEKVTYQRDSKIMNFATITIQEEDHTVGNVIRKQLLKDPRIRFSGYRKPHPLFNTVEIKLQTNGEIDPASMVQVACEQLNTQLDQVSKSFENALMDFKGEKRFGMGTMGGYQY